MEKGVCPGLCQVNTITVHIMRALAAVEDKFLDSLDPAKEGFKVYKSAYFTGVLKNLAKEENIEF